jgi:hypothetical protein
MAVRLSASRAGRPLPPARFLVLVSVSGYSAALRIRSIENPMTSSGIDLPAFSIVPQPTALPRAPSVSSGLFYFLASVFSLMWSLHFTSPTAVFLTGYRDVSFCFHEVPGMPRHWCAAMRFLVCWVLLIQVCRSILVQCREPRCGFIY